MNQLADFVVVRAGQNQWIDSDFQTNWRGARQAYRAALIGFTIAALTPADKSNYGWILSMATWAMVVPGRMVNQLLEWLAALNDILQFHPGIRIIIKTLDLPPPLQVLKIKKGVNPCGPDDPRLCQQTRRQVNEQHANEERRIDKRSDKNG